MENAEEMVLTLLGLAFSRPAQPEAAHACENPEIMRVCSRCGKVKEVCCVVDGEP